MIACAFPPTGGPGVQRSAKFAKYLPRYGWLPTVWTADLVEGLPRDRSLLDDLPHAIGHGHVELGRDTDQTTAGVEADDLGYVTNVGHECYVD